MYKINGTTITLTRGDSFYCQLALAKNGEAYTPEEGDVIRFAMKKNIFDEDTLIEKTIPTDTMILGITPAETKSLSFGSYVYDIEITFADGDVDTFISEAKFVITPEVI